MKLDREYTLAHKAALVAGLLVLGIEIWACLEIFHEESRQYINATMATIIVASIATVVALKVSRDAWRQKIYGISICLFIAFLFGAGFTITTTLDRTATMRDQKLARMVQSSSEINELKQELAQAKADARSECSNVVGRTSFGEQCKMRQMEVAKVEEKIEDAMSKIDSMGIRLAGMIPYITPEIASKYQPALLPIATFLLEVFLLTFGSDGREVPPEFTMELGGRDALNAKALRFAEQWQLQYKRLPKPSDIERALNVTPTVAKRLAYMVKEEA